MSNLRSFSNKLFFEVEKARKSIIWLETFDFGYILNTLERIHNNKNEILLWDASTCETSIYGTKEVVEVGFLGYAIKTIESRCEKILIARVSEVMFAKDGDENEERLVPRIQHFVFWNDRNDMDSKKTLILVAATHFEVPGLEHICERLTLPLPDIQDIDEELGFINTNVVVRDVNDRVIDVGRWKKVKDAVVKDSNGFYSMRDSMKGLVCRDNQMRVLDLVYNDYKKLKYPFSDDFYDNANLFKEHYQELVDSLCGMHLYDIKELLNSLTAKGEHNEIQYEYDREGELLDDKDRKLIDIISERKTEIIKNSGLLEIIEYKEGYYNQVADIEKLKDYIDNVKNRIDFPNNYPPKLPKPKGILLVGAPGCGKSESAKAIASKLEKPLYRLNIGSLLGHKYGQSENRFIEALQIADASAPCVLWIDEIEKAFAGAGNESENDDTLTHIVGHFLTWMQEHKTMVYLVATANDLSRMKPEMLRKGRWDEIFYLSYPSDKGCLSIIKAVIEKKFEIKLDSVEGNVDVLANAMSKVPMSGSEIENILVETVKFNPTYRMEEKTWCVNDGDIAYILLRTLKDRKVFQELNDKTEEVLKSMSVDEKFSLLKIFAKTRQSSEGCFKDPFLTKKIDDEIQEINIKNFGRLSKGDEKNVRELLRTKYDGQYNFTPASSNFSHE